MKKNFVTKDSGKRVSFDSGFVRDVQEGKPRYDLIPHELLTRLAELYTRGDEDEDHLSGVVWNLFSHEWHTQYKAKKK